MDSSKLKEKIKNIIIPVDYNMVSLDVKSLFTKVSLESVVKSRDSRWNYAKKNTKISINKFKKTIYFLMNNTFFKFYNNFDQQTHGMHVLGSPISAIL